ncbi:isoleucyl-tRNA synthetase [Campylobacter mucosalis]|uniref:isoleucyl-tRNA synthetase n=1 Tax=Campylobacter mucosalis TaxID=202 RepID=UPI0014704BBF|nr:isoleucyl-tRNA synthetase [Campylobacter mucosalis]
MKLLNALFVGALLTFALVFMLFVGLWNNYFKFYGVDEYFNAIFVDNVPFLWLLPVCVFVGYAIFYAPFRKIFRVFYVLLVVCILFSWHKDIGLNVGQWLFMKDGKDINLQNQESVPTKEIYAGRYKIYILRSDTAQILKIPKS